MQDGSDKFGFGEKIGEARKEINCAEVVEECVKIATGRLSLFCKPSNLYAVRRY